MKALETMRKLCASREMCTSDISAKLTKMGVETGEQESIIKSLTEDKFLDDSRYATAFVRDKSRLSGWGPVKIKFHLRQKSISDRIISVALESIDKAAEQERLHKILLIKYKSLAREEEKEKNLNRLVRFALSRGFDYGISIKVAKEIIG